MYITVHEINYFVNQYVCVYELFNTVENESINFKLNSSPQSHTHFRFERTIV